jgi:hypothetical protein
MLVRSFSVTGIKWNYLRRVEIFDTRFLTAVTVKITVLSAAIQRSLLKMEAGGFS